MYKLLLVDDEPEILEGLREVVPFEELGFQVVGEAANGVEALQLADTHQPDLIITDIRMPLMDGLTLCRKVREQSPTTQFIILSGYDDFEYARQAIEVKTLGYLLKPISAAEFIQMMKDTRENLDEATRQRSDIRRLRQHFQASLPLLRESLMASLLSGGISRETALIQAKRFEVDILAPAYAVMLLHIGEEQGPERIKDPELLPFAVHNIFTEVLGAHGRCQVFHYNGMLAGILRMEEESEEAFSRGLKQVEEARSIAAYYLRCELFIGLSTLCKSLEALPAAARQAESALAQSQLSRDNPVLCITDVDRGSNTDLIMEDFQLRQLSNAIKVGEQDRALQQLQLIMARCRQGSPAAKAYQIYLMELFMCFLRILPDMSLERAAFDEDFDRISKAIFSSLPPIDEAESLFAQLLQKLVHLLQDSRQSAGRLLAQQAQDWLLAHFSQENVSLEQLCLHLHVSPSYFSQVFKRETRKTFHQHLTQLRMDRALTLLTTSDMRTAQVAAEVGLPDPSYFSYSFKKHFGFSPSQARSRQGEAP